jgi:UDP:flavonoid glycosyltransferase YjiC (YdhE family)
VMFTSGQHGILSLGLAAGLRQVVLPQHLEHLYMSRRAEAEGVASVIWPRTAPADAIIDTLKAAWDDALMGARAGDLARKLDGDFVTDDAALLRQRLAPYL